MASSEQLFSNRFSGDIVGNKYEKTGYMLCWKENLTLQEQGHIQNNRKCSVLADYFEMSPLYFCSTTDADIAVVITWTKGL